MSKFDPAIPHASRLKRVWTRISGLQQTLLLFVVLPLMLLTALGIRIGLEQANQFQEQRLKNDLELIGRAISIPVGGALSQGDQQAIELALGSVFVLGEVYGASVFDVDGVRIASAGITESDLSRTTIPTEIVATGEGQEGYSRVAGRNLFSHFLPLFDSAGQIQGLIQITRLASDFHHALHSVLTKETSGYYSDFGQIADLAAALRHGFVFRGQYSAFRNASFGGETVGLRGRQLVGFNQNHDQIGNRAVGDRLSATLNTVQLQIAAALTLLSPFVPMLFMGEEWGASTPWQYFTDHEEEELADSIRKGRQAEFAEHGWGGTVPDPQDPATVEASTLRWAEVDSPGHAEVLAFYRDLLRLRREEPGLRSTPLGEGSLTREALTGTDGDEGGELLTVTRGEVQMVARLGGDGEHELALRLTRRGPGRRHRAPGRERRGRREHAKRWTQSGDRERLGRRLGRLGAAPGLGVRLASR